MNACCSGCGCCELPSPSRVVTLPLPTFDTGYTHERTALPSMCTVQAPHCASPQPKRGPRSPRPSRSAYRSGMSRSSTSRPAVFPLTVRVIFIGSCNLVGAGHFGERDTEPLRDAFAVRRVGLGEVRELPDLNLARHRLHRRDDVADQPRLRFGTDQAKENPRLAVVVVA